MKLIHISEILYLSWLLWSYNVVRDMKKRLVAEVDGMSIERSAVGLWHVAAISSVQESSKLVSLSACGMPH